MEILYIDDLIILANKIFQLQWFKSELEMEFDISESYIICLEVEFESNREVCTITMNQISYIEEILKCSNMEECK